MWRLKYGRKDPADLVTVQSDGSVQPQAVETAPEPKDVRNISTQGKAGNGAVADG
jgi:hypothetical protein